MALLIDASANITIYVIAGIILFFVGTIIFSYLNRVIEILPEGIEDYDENMTKEELAAEKLRQKELAKDKRKRLCQFGTACPHCGKTWKLKDMIPIFSWLVNGKKCPDCGENISARHTIIELTGGILAVIPIFYYGLSLQGLLVFLVYCVLMTIAVIDMDTQYIPPELNIVLAVIGIISIVVLPGPTLVERGIGVVCVSLPLLLITLIVPGAFGGGDIKMMAAIGILLGWKGTVMAFIIGLLLGGAYGAYVLITKKMGRKEHFAFGPFLAIGIAISIYADCGTKFMNMYIDYIMAAFQPY
ncbi:MAG: prepilin peptidase [Lachnospiraceae bacterium]